MLNDAPVKTPLSTAQLDARTLGMTADRVRESLVALISHFPPESRSMGGMAQWLGVSKSSVQRLMEALTPGQDAAATLRRLPGEEALLAIVEAAERRKIDGSAVARAQAAVEQLGLLVRTHARSQRAFNELLKAGVGQIPPLLPTRADRRALYNAAVGVSGESLRVKSVVALVGPSPRDPARLRVTSLVSLLDARRRTFARPLVASLIAGWWTRNASPSPNSPGAAGVPTAEVVDQFCTAPVRPVPIVSADAHTALMIDFPDTPDAEGWLGPLDVSMWFMHDRSTNPQSDPAARLSAAARIHQPTQVLIHDIYLHRTLADRFVPMASVMSMVALPGDLPGASENALWFERFPDATEVERLAADVRGRGCSLCTKHAELADYAIKRAEVDIDEFVPFRCLVEYPVWQLEYRVEFPRH